MHALKYPTATNLLSMLTLMLFFASMETNAQNDTIFYDSRWKEVPKNDASFFRIPMTKEGELYRVQDFYSSGQLQMTALSKSDTNDVWQGLVTWYNEDGSLFQQGTYDNNRLNGTFISYEGDEKHTAIYENGYFISGRMVSTYGAGHWYQEKKGDSLMEVYFDKSRKGIRYENYSTVGKGNYLSKYYGENGTPIGNREVLPNGYSKGVEVFYYYDPMRVKQIIYSPYGQQLITSTFYENGQIREDVVQGNQWSKTFYTEEGEIIGSIRYEMDGTVLRPFEGKEIRFGYGKSGSFGKHPVSSATYDDGEIMEDTRYHEKGKVKSTTAYENGTRILQTSYDENGQQIAKMVYKDYRPFDGTETQEDKMATYAEGELVEEVWFYRDTDTPQRKITKSSEVYYDTEGNVLGTLKLKDENDYPVPWEGERYTLGFESGEIFSINTYAEGSLVKRTDFTKRLVGKQTHKTFKTIEEYEDGSYKKTKEIQFYSNGTIQSEILIKDYKEISGVFYDEQGKQIGAYDFVKKDGTLYKFFRNTDDIELMEEYQDGSLVKSKLFIQSKYTDYYEMRPVLVQEIDVNCCATFYTDDGKPFAELTYKDKRPWQGIAYDGSSRTKYAIREGKRNGTYQKFDYNGEIVEEGQFIDDLEEGLFNYYNYLGDLKRSEMYKNGKRNGKATFYALDGTVQATLTYENDVPKNGTKILETYGSKGPDQETYVNGKLTERITYDKDRKKVTTSMNGEQEETKVYHQNSGQLLLRYGTENGYVHGEVLRYNEKGVQEYRATVKDGKLTSGTLLVTSNDYDVKISHIVVTKDEDKLTAAIHDIEGNLLFKGEEYLVMTTNPEYLNRLNLGLDYLTENRLY